MRYALRMKWRHAVRATLSPNASLTNCSSPLKVLATRTNVPPTKRMPKRMRMLATNTVSYTSMSTIKCISRTWLDRNYSHWPKKLTARAQTDTLTRPPISSTRSSHDQFDNSLMRNEEIAQLLLPSVHQPRPLCQSPHGQTVVTPRPALNRLTAHTHPSWWLKTQPHCGLVIISNECAAVSVSVLLPPPSAFVALALALVFAVAVSDKNKT